MSQSRRDIGAAPRKDRNKPTRIKPEVARWGVKWARASKISFSHDDMYGMDEGEADALSELELLGEDESEDTAEPDRLEARQREEEEARRKEEAARREEQEKKQREEEEEAKRQEAKRREEEEAKKRREEEEARRREEEKQREQEEAEAKRRKEERQQEELRQAREAFQAAWNELGYEACLGISIADECKSLEDLKRKIDRACETGKKEDYELVTAKLLPSMGQLIAKIGKADEERNKNKAKWQETLNSYKEQFKVSIANLNKQGSSKVKRYNEEYDASFTTVNEQLKKHQKDVVASVVNHNLDQIKVTIDNTDDDANDLKAKKQDRIDKQNAQRDRKEYASFKFNDSTTWEMQALLTNKIPESLIKANSVVVSDITAGNLTDGGPDGNAVTGQGYHCHATSGSGGFSFAYNHLGGCRVQPVIYDYSVNRDGNDYNWVLQGGRKTGGAAKKPSYVQARRAPEPEPEPEKKVTKGKNKTTKK
jgi:hypothetical protein